MNTFSKSDKPKLRLEMFMCCIFYVFKNEIYFMMGSINKYLLGEN